MKFFKKSLAIVSLITVFSSSLLILPKAETSTINYSQVDNLQIKNKTIITALNGQGFEVLALRPDDRLQLLSSIKLDLTGGKTYDILTYNENQIPTAYITTGKYLYKYDLSNPTRPVKLAKVSQSIGYIYDVNQSYKPNRILVAGTKGVAELDSTTFKLKRILSSESSYSVTTNSKGDILYHTAQEIVIITNLGRRIKKPIPVTQYRKTWLSNNQQAFFPGNQNFQTVNPNFSLNNPSQKGDSVTALDKNLYWTNGWGVQKTTFKLEPVNFQSINLKAGWAQGITSSYPPQGARLVVAAQDRIYLLNTDLKFLETYTKQPSLKIAAQTSSSPLIDSADLDDLDDLMDLDDLDLIDDLNSLDDLNQSEKTTTPIIPQQTKPESTQKRTAIKPGKQTRPPITTNNYLTISLSQKSAEVNTELIVYLQNLAPHEKVKLEVGPYHKRFSGQRSQKLKPNQILDARNLIVDLQADIFGNIVKNITIPDFTNKSSYYKLRALALDSGQHYSIGFQATKPKPIKTIPAPVPTTPQVTAPANETKVAPKTNRKITRTIEKSSKWVNGKEVITETIYETIELID